MGSFDTPLRVAALGMLAVAATVLAASLALRHDGWRMHVLALVAGALGLVLLSNALR